MSRGGAGTVDGRSAAPGGYRAVRIGDGAGDGCTRSITRIGRLRSQLGITGRPGSGIGRCTGAGDGKRGGAQTTSPAAGREPSPSPGIFIEGIPKALSASTIWHPSGRESERISVSGMTGPGHDPHDFSSLGTHGHAMRITFSVEMIHEIHAEIIDTFRELAQRNGDDETGIVYEVRDPGTLAFIVLAINLASTPIEQAAVALHRIASQPSVLRRQQEDGPDRCRDHPRGGRLVPGGCAVR